jgi:peptidoglycan/LPS O-acetylase OafA/YrhL
MDATALDRALTVKARHVSEYYPLFDWLRATLALTVFLSHSGVIAWPQAGNLAVQVFFALSGFLIGGILLKSKTSDLPRFYFNRATRIWIPYTVAIALLALVTALYRDPITTKMLEFFFYKVTFVYNFFGPSQIATFRDQMPLRGSGNHFWSICVEEQFYLFAPLVLVVAASWGRSLLLWIVIACLGIYFEWYGSIAFGVIAAISRYQFGDWYRDRRAVVGLVFALICAITAFIVSDKTYALAAPLFSVSIVLLLTNPGTPSTIGALLGGVSYPFYLNNWLGGFVVHSVFKRLGIENLPISIPLSLLMGFLVSTGLYLWVDRRVMANRSRWFLPLRGFAAMVSGFSLVTTGLVGAWFLYMPADL